MKYTAILKQEGGWWIGWVQDVSGVNCQERTREELLESIKEALSEALGRDLGVDPLNEIST